MFHTREDRDFTTYHVARRRLGIPARQLTEVLGVDLERPQWPKFKRLLLSDDHLRIRNPNYGGRVPLEERNTPGGEENRRTGAYGNDAYGSRPLDGPWVQIRGVQSLFHLSLPFLSGITFEFAFSCSLLAEPLLGHNSRLPMRELTWTGALIPHRGIRTI